MADDQGQSAAIDEAVGPGGMPQAYYDTIKDRFAEARDLRLKYRPQGTSQYTSDFTGELAKYAVDPYADEGRAREPITDEVECLFIGGGFSALLTAARLRERGVTSIRIVERGADVGGTWYWNRYPGAACDVPAYDYLPLLDEMNYVPSRLYAKGPEIFAHCQAIAKRYDLYDLAVFRTTVVSTTWDDKAKLWTIRTDRGDAMRAKFVICANGTLSKPKLSKIAGLESFKGHSFHTSRWDYAYTGQDLENLSDKVVGIIGTGASAVQAIPRLAKNSQGALCLPAHPFRHRLPQRQADRSRVDRAAGSPVGSRPGARSTCAAATATPKSAPSSTRSRARRRSANRRTRTSNS